MPNKMIYEIIDDLRHSIDKRAALRQNACPLLRTVLQCTFNPNIQFYTKKFPRKYIKQDVPPEMGYSRLDTEIKRIYLFIENHPMVPPNMSVERKDDLLLQFLEGLEYREAVTIIDMFNKDLKVPGLTRDMVKEVFPDLEV